MATIFLEPGSSASGDLSFWTSVTGTVTSDNVSPIRNPRSIKIATATPGNVTINGIVPSPRRISFRYRFQILPASDCTVMSVTNATPLTVFNILMTSAGKLKINAVGAGSATGNTALTVNSPCRITVSFTLTSSTVFSIFVYINGKFEVSFSNSGTLTNVSPARLTLNSSNAMATGNFVWFDDIYVDDGSTLDDPGNIAVTFKRPVSAGAANNWTTQIGAGGSGYGTGHSPQVNEIPLSTTNGWSIASASLIVEEYTIEAANVGALDVSNPRYKLVDYMGWVFFKSGTADTRNIILAGSTTNISTTTSYAMYEKVAGSTTYPSTNAAIGMDNNSLIALASLAECGVLLAYKLPRRISVT